MGGLSRGAGTNLEVLYLVLEVYFCREETRVRKKRGSKTSVRARYTPVTYKSTLCVPSIRRQCQILSLVQGYWRGKINQLSCAARGFLT